jgi:hypothetical protein
MSCATQLNVPAEGSSVLTAQRGGLGQPCAESCSGAPARARYFETILCGPMEKETITSWSITNKTR